jgi:UDP-glucuronate 4-epimerase
MTAKTMLVTGGAGFIGSHLSEALVQRGDRVTVLDNFDNFYDPAVKWANLRSIADDIEVVQGDIRNDRDLDRVFSPHRYDAVVHLAARAGVRPSIVDPVLYDEVNVVGTTKLLERIRLSGIPHLVFGSSSSVYGATSVAPFGEDQVADSPSSPYASTKRAGEMACYASHHLYGTTVNALRFFTVYGPRQRPEMAIHKFTRLIASGRSIPVFGDGESRRDYTFVDDIVAGVLASIDRPRGFRVYNLGTTDTTSLTTLVEMLAERLGRPAVIDRQPFQGGDVPLTYADITRARDELGYAPATPLAKGLDVFAGWFNDRVPERPEQVGAAR